MIYDGIFETELREEITAFSTEVAFQKDDELIDYNQKLSFIPLLQEGVIKVFKENKNGDEILLYFLESGDTCAFTLQCLHTSHTSEIRAVAETDGSLIRIPVDKLDEWLAKYSTWRQFILNSYQNRIFEMLDVIDSIAFQNLDTRLLNYLKDKAMVNNSMTLHMTHQEIANDINSSRVVISRMLKKLENQGVITIGRNEITLLKL